MQNQENRLKTKITNEFLILKNKLILYPIHFDDNLTHYDARIRHGYGRDIDCTHKKISIGYNTTQQIANFRVSEHHS